MIEGVVNASYEAMVTRLLRGPDGDVRDIEAVIDTGYSGFLTLPPRLVAELGLPFVTSAQAILANGSEENLRCPQRHGTVGQSPRRRCLCVGYDAARRYALARSVRPLRSSQARRSRSHRDIELTRCRGASPYRHAKSDRRIAARAGWQAA